MKSWIVTCLALVLSQDGIRAQDFPVAQLHAYIEKTPNLADYFKMTPNKPAFTSAGPGRPSSSRAENLPKKDILSLLNPLPGRMPSSRYPDRDRAVLSSVQASIEGWFTRCDLNDNGFLHEIELAKAFRGQKAKPHVLDKIDGLLSKGANVDLSYDQLAALRPEAKALGSYPDYHFLSFWDKNGDRSISRTELSHYVYHVGAHVKANLALIDQIEDMQKKLQSKSVSVAQRGIYLAQHAQYYEQLMKTRAEFEWLRHLQKMQQQNQLFRWTKYIHAAGR